MPHTTRNDYILALALAPDQKETPEYIDPPADDVEEQLLEDVKGG